MHIFSNNGNLSFYEIALKKEQKNEANQDLIGNNSN